MQGGGCSCGGCERSSRWQRGRRTEAEENQKWRAGVWALIGPLVLDPRGLVWSHSDGRSGHKEDMLTAHLRLDLALTLREGGASWP